MMQILCDGVAVRLRLDSSQKNSMLVVGGSRMGKTFFMSNYAQYLMQENNEVHLIDLGEKWSSSDKERLSSAGAAAVYRVGKDGGTLKFHSNEDMAGCAKVIADSSGCRSPGAAAAVRHIFRQLFADKGNAFKLADVISALERESTDGEDAERRAWSAKLSGCLECFSGVPDICFKSDAGTDSGDGSMIWDLSWIDETYTVLCANLILYCLFSRQRFRFREGIAGKNVYVIVDEFQNINCGKKSIFGVCLTEGQKYGLNLILATQFLEGNFSEAVISQFKQGGYRFYFRLTEEEAAAVSRQLAADPEERRDIQKRLAGLPRGHCLMMGPHSIGNQREVSENIRFVEIVESSSLCGQTGEKSAGMAGY